MHRHRSLRDLCHRQSLRQDIACSDCRWGNIVFAFDKSLKTPGVEPAFLLVLLFGRRRDRRSDLGDLGLNVGKCLADKISSIKERIAGHLKHGERRSFEICQHLNVVKIYVSRVQPPEVAKVRIERKQLVIKFVEVTILTYLTSPKLFKQTIFRVIEVYLREVGHGTIRLARKYPLLQHSRPGVGVWIADKPQPEPRVFDVVIEYLQVAAGRRERFGQLLDDKEPSMFGCGSIVHFQQIYSYPHQ